MDFSIGNIGHPGLKWKGKPRARILLSFKVISTVPSWKRHSKGTMVRQAGHRKSDVEKMPKNEKYMRTYVLNIIYTILAGTLLGIFFVGYYYR